ncbi:MAG: thiamine pyrophosphate-binding protein, partial [Methanoculleus sp.]|nr:thiamine pyrophosphate-binding protein [Methanoculleus sp.]
MRKTTYEESPTTVADVMVSELEAWGVNLYFGMPGASALPLVDAVRKNKNVRYIGVRHEQTAALAASAYNKFTGKVAVCLTIAGPGATNLATGLYDAKEDRASVLSLNGQVKTQYAGPGGIQEIDQDAFFRPIAVFNNTVADSTTAIKLLTRALRYAVVARGVAQLSFPNDVQREPLEPDYCERETCLPEVRVAPTDETVAAAAEAIDGAARPVILAGFGAMRAAGPVLDLAE